MNILIGILALIGAMCILFVGVITVIIQFDLFPVDTKEDTDDDIDMELVGNIQKLIEEDEQNNQIF